MRVLPAGDAVTRIGEWELALEIASHESTVFVARRPGPRSFSRWVAVRYVGPFLGDDATLGDAIVDDARRASQLSHPCVLTVHDAGTALGGRFIVTDYVEGGTLAELFDAGRVEAEVLGSIAIDVLSGLAAIHAATDGAGRSLALVHGRVSPRNVVVGLDGRARIADLGLARLGRRDASGDAFASFHYAAPEVLRGGDADARADVFSVGMLLYEGLAGRHPYADAASAKEAAERLAQPMPLLSVASPRISAPLAAAIARAIAPDREMRYRSSDAFSAALEAAGMRAAARAVGRIAAERLGPSVRARREACHAWSRASGPPP
ncbi:MAG TPA: serine/threonine-protein kinase, partial [Polyangiaceae bacterium]|nr:serine/threonine-protein kinase [Polyangiaceae bacterium]